MTDWKRPLFMGIGWGTIPPSNKYTRLKVTSSNLLRSKSGPARTFEKLTISKHCDARNPAH